MKARVWIGRALTGLVTLILLGSGLAKLFHLPKMMDGLLRSGLPEASIAPIAILELCCLSLYLIPRPAVLGTVLLTGYFGGATVTHIIGRENFVPPLIIGALIWAGAYFRIFELGALLPMRKGLR